VYGRRSGGVREGKGARRRRHHVGVAEKGGEARGAGCCRYRIACRKRFGAGEAPVRHAKESDVEPRSVRPIGDRVLVVIDDRAETIGSIVIPHIAQDLPNTATVVRVGKRVRTCAVGDRVLIEKYAHADREYVMLGEPSRRHLLVSESQVICVLEASHV
jgi:co-chaperonin GroES (HSP10)